MRIMFVCLGNICRSPAAEAVCAHLLDKRGLKGLHQVASCGMSGYHVGEAADSRMRREARKRGIEITSRAAAFEPWMLDEYDLVLAMDRQNYRELCEYAHTEHRRDRIHLFREYDPQGPGDVPDPYYGGADGFSAVLDIITRTAEKLIDTLEGN